MSMLLELLRDAFLDADIPPTFYEAKKIINRLDSFLLLRHFLKTHIYSSLSSPSAAAGDYISHLLPLPPSLSVIVVVVGGTLSLASPFFCDVCVYD
ncbi:hypothetical protein K1719_037214 [Acacia pycnantha]|nr:hypothetical protein K1719_037214 [Acacia pycnantha]